MNQCPKEGDFYAKDKIKNRKLSQAMQTDDEDQSGESEDNQVTVNKMHQKTQSVDQNNFGGFPLADDLKADRPYKRNEEEKELAVTEQRRSLFDIAGQTKTSERNYEQFDHSALDQRVQNRHSNQQVRGRRRNQKDRRAQQQRQDSGGDMSNSQQNTEQTSHKRQNMTNDAMEQQDMFFEELEEDDVGTSPINLPDPSVFSDLGENGPHIEQNLQQLNAKDNYYLEEENEKRQLEQIYLVAGKDRKTNISVIELYGFFSWNLSTVCFIIYMIWAFVPEKVLNDFGIYQVPDRYYAIAIPLWFCVTVVFLLQLYVSICIWATPNIESYETLQDKFTILKNPNFEKETEKTDLTQENEIQLENLRTPQMMDNMRNIERQQSHQVPLRGNQSQQILTDSSPQGYLQSNSMQNEQEQIQNKMNQDDNQTIDGLGREQVRTPSGQRINIASPLDGLNPIGVVTAEQRVKKPSQRPKKAKIADVVELPITVVNNVLYQPLRQQMNKKLMEMQQTH